MIAKIRYLRSVAIVFILAVSACTSAAVPTAATAPQVTTPQQAPAGTAKPGGTLQVGLRGNPTTLDPHKNTSSFDRAVLYAIYDRLVDSDENLRYVPQVAESWEVAPDGASITFRLRAGVKFSDGTPLDAAAVKFNLERVKDPATKSGYAPEFGSVSAVEATDERTVRLKLSEPAPGLLSSLAERGGLLVSPKAVRESGDELGRKPVGSGPFTFSEWLQDDHVTLQRNAQYWRTGKPYVDKIVFKIIPDENVKMTNLKSGALDIVDTVPPKDIASITTSPGLQYAKTTGLATWSLVMNETRQPFGSRQVREAVAWAIDREAIQRSLFFGTGTVAQGMLPPSSWAYDAQALTTYKADAARAKQILSQAGVPVAPVKIMVINQPLRTQIAQAIQSDLAKIGLAATLDTKEVAAYSAALAKGDYDMVLLFWAGRVDPDGTMFAWFNPQGNWDKYGYDNSRVSDLLTKARGTYDLSARKGFYADAQRLISADVPMAFLIHEEEGKAFAKRVQGFVPNPDGVLRFTDIWLRP